jgi:hypothetical protein
MTTVAQIEMISPITRKRFRVEEFHKMTELGILPEERGWEIVDGYLIDKMAIGSKHASTVKRLYRILTNLVKENASVSVLDPIHLNDYNDPEPDVALL